MPSVYMEPPPWQLHYAGLHHTRISSRCHCAHAQSSAPNSRNSLVGCLMHMRRRIGNMTVQGKPLWRAGGATAMERAIFLDRDGTLVHARHYPTRPADLRLYAGIGPDLRLL